MPEFPIDTDWFKQKMKEKRLSQARLGPLLGTDEGAVYRVVHGQRAIWVYEVIKLARIFGVSVYEIIKRAGAEPLAKELSLPIVGSLNSTLDVTISNKYPPVASIPVLEQGAEGFICDDNASPYYGWIFVHVPSPSIQPAAISRLSVVKLAGGKMVIRFLKQGLHAGRFDLTPLAIGSNLSNFEILSASPVLFIRPLHGEHISL